MLSIRGTKQKFSLGLRAADGKETGFYTYDPDSGPAEMRLCRRAQPERRWCSAVRSPRPSARC
jgi:hypothetical protein